jgi:hypothetical protein
VETRRNCAFAAGDAFHCVEGVRTGCRLSNSLSDRRLCPCRRLDPRQPLGPKSLVDVVVESDENEDSRSRIMNRGPCLRHHPWRKSLVRVDAAQAGMVRIHHGGVLSSPLSLFRCMQSSRTRGSPCYAPVSLDFVCSDRFGGDDRRGCDCEFLPLATFSISRRLSLAAAEAELVVAAPPSDLDLFRLPLDAMHVSAAIRGDERFPCPLTVSPDQVITRG